MSPTRTRTADTPHPALMRALRRLLRPIVRLLLRHQITHPDFSTFLKSVFVEVARDDLAAAGESETASRISLITGVHRKDLRHLLAESSDDLPMPESVSLGARLVRRWMSDPLFLDRRGRPRPLLRQSDDDAAPGFEQLVASISSDVRPRSVLDEWLRMGIVEVDSKDRVRLRLTGFVPSKGFEEKAHFLGRNLHDHISAAAHNLSDEEPAMLERSVQYSELSESSVEELAALSEKLGMTALREIDRRAQTLSRRDSRERASSGSGEEPTTRVNFGVYFFHDREAAAEAEADPSRPDREPEHS